MTVQIYSSAPMERKLKGNLHFYYHSFILLPSNVSYIYVARSNNAAGAVLFMPSTCITEVFPGVVVIGKLCTSVRSSLVLVIADLERTVDFSRRKEWSKYLLLFRQDNLLFISISYYSQQLKILTK